MDIHIGLHISRCFQVESRFSRLASYLLYREDTGTLLDAHNGPTTFRRGNAYHHLFARLIFFPIRLERQHLSGRFTSLVTTSLQIWPIKIGHHARTMSPLRILQRNVIGTPLFAVHLEIKSSPSLLIRKQSHLFHRFVVGI